MKKTVAERMQEHRSRGANSAAWLRAVPEQTWARIGSAHTLPLALEKEAIHTGGT